MLKNIFNKKHTKAPAVKKDTASDLQSRIKLLAENFLTLDSIEIIKNKKSYRISPIKWLYPGYGDYKNHAIIPEVGRKSAVEMVNEPDFVNHFLQNKTKSDINGSYGYFLCRIESNYINLALNATKIFGSINEKKLDDYDVLVMIKQCRRLIPKLSSETMEIELKHIEVFGEVFNKLKSKITESAEDVSDEKRKIILMDIPKYNNSSITIENSLDSYYIFRLAESLEKISKKIESVSIVNTITILDHAIDGIERVKDLLYGSDNSSRFNLVIENMEKVGSQLSEIKNLYIQLDQ